MKKHRYRKLLFFLSWIFMFLLGCFARGRQVVKTQISQNPGRVTGIGGIFFKCKDPSALKAWYRENLGLDTDEWGTNFEWRQAHDPVKKGFTQWSPFSAATRYFEPSEKPFMINYRVDDLVALANNLEKAGVKILDTITVYEYGKFLHILDAEGNKLELWEPDDQVYDGMVKGRTK